MSRENVEVVRRFYDALNAGDLEAAAASCDEHVEYVNPEYAAEPGTRVGTKALRDALDGLLTSFIEFRCEIKEITPIGDRVSVIEESSGRGRSSDVPFNAVHGHLFTLLGGRIMRLQWFRTAEELLEAVGLRE